MGGAGGYLPDTRTPEVWAKVALGIASYRRKMSEMDEYNAIMRDLTIPRVDKLAVIQRGWSIWAKKYPNYR
jgi:hypothetical protein